MDSIRGLVQVHVNIGKLEKAIKKCRRNLIKECTNNNSSVYISKISYSGFADQLKRETAKFDKLLQDLDVMNDGDVNDEIAEIVDNIESDSESTGSDREFAALYHRDSVPTTESLSVSVNEIKEIKPLKPSIKNKSVNPDNIIQKSKLNTNFIPNTKKITKNIPQINIHSINGKQKKVEKILNAKTNGKNNGIRPTSVNNKKRTKTKTLSVIHNIEPWSPKKVKKAPNKKQSHSNKERIKGFEVYKNKPIYGSTMLFCHETCGENESKLKKWLIKYGDFDKLAILEIIFRRKYDGTNYSLIRVRGPLNVIKQKMDKLNYKQYGNVIHIFERSRYNENNNNNKKPQKVLYVNNFDINDKESHNRFTNLFASYGELKEYVIMGCDKNGDPFAIVQFKHLKHAKEWVVYDGECVFDGKKLNISYSAYK